MMSGKPRTHDDVDSYLAEVSEPSRTALQKLRRDIHSAAPECVEVISYNLPSFRHRERPLLSFGAAKNHCALYAGSILAMFEKELAHYDTSKGTLRFQAERPLPTALVRKIVKASIRQIEENSKEKTRATTTRKIPKRRA